MAQSPEELERLRNSGAAGFQPRQQQPAPAPKKKLQPSEEMAGVDQMGRWPKPDSISLAMSQQPNTNAAPQAVTAAYEPQATQETDNKGFKSGLINPLAATALDTVGALVAKPADSLRNAVIGWAGGDPESVEGGPTRDQDRAFSKLQGRINAATDATSAVTGAVSDGLGFVVDKAKSAVLSGTGAEKAKPAVGTGPLTGQSAPRGAELDALNTQLDALDAPPLKKSAVVTPEGQTTPVAETVIEEAGAKNDTKTESQTAGKTGTEATPTSTAQDAPLENDIRMTINQEGNKSFSGRNVGAGATLNGKPFSSSVNVVPSESMKQLAATVNPPMAPRQPQQQAPAIGFASRQTPQRAPKSEFEKQVEREIFRQATTAMRGSQNGQLTASQRGSLDKLAGNMSGERSGFDQQVLRNDGMLNQTAISQAGQDRRDGARLALDTERLAGDQYAQGFQIRQNERLEALREAYTAAETPEQRSAIAEQLQILNGSNSNRKVQDDYVMVDQVIQNSMGDPTTVRVAVDPATNRVLGGMQQTQGGPPPGTVVKGRRFLGGDPYDKSNWEEA